MSDAHAAYYLFTAGYCSLPTFDITLAAMQTTTPSISAPTNLHAVLSIVVGHQTVPGVSFITHPTASVDFKYTLVHGLTKAEATRARTALNLFRQSLERVSTTSFLQAMNHTLRALMFSGEPPAAEKWEKSWQASLIRNASENHEKFECRDILGWQVFTKDEDAFLTSKLTDGIGFILDQEKDRGPALWEGQVRFTLPGATEEERDKGFGASQEAEAKWLEGKLLDNL